MSAEIHGLPGVEWSAQAALAEASQRVPDGSQLIVAWITPEGRLHYSQSGLARRDLHWIGSILAEEAMHRDDGTMIQV